MSKHFCSSRKSRKKRAERQGLVFIVVEGETEKLYLQELCNELNILADVQIVCEDPDLFNSVEFVQEKAKFFKHKWCVFDVPPEDEKEQLKRFKEGVKLAKKYKIPLASSIPDFEIWFYFHFSSSTAPLNKKQLHKKLKEFLPDYEKATSYHSILYPKLEMAIKNGEKIRKQLEKSCLDKDFINPSSGVGELVKLLLDLKKNP